MTVKINSFFYKSLKFQGATSSDYTPEEILAMVKDNLHRKVKGKNSGSWIVPLDGRGFQSPTVKVTDEMTVIGDFKARREGEDKFLSFFTTDPEIAYGFHPEAEAIIYEVSQLKADCEREGGEPRDFYEEGDHEFELVIAKSPAGEPMDLGTMVRNQKALTGGTPAHYSSEEWCEAALFALTHVRIR